MSLDALKRHSEAPPKLFLQQRVLSALGPKWTSAKPIFATFRGVDRFRELIASSLLLRKKWISYLAGSPTDCVSGIYPT